MADFEHHPAFPGGNGSDIRYPGKARKVKTKPKPARSEKPKRSVRGRKDADKQERAIEVLVVKDKRAHLISLNESAKAAAADFSDAIKAAAEAAGVQSSVLRSYIKAYGTEAFEDRKRNAMQLSLLFDTVPE